MKLTIGRRVTLGFVVCTALTATLGGYAAFNFSTVSNGVDVIVEDAMPGIAISGVIKNISLDNFCSAIRHVNTESVEEMNGFDKRLEENKETLNKALADYEKTITTPEDRAAFDRVVAARKPWVDSLNALLPVSRANDKAQADIMINGPMSAAYRTLSEAADALASLNENRGRTAGASLQATAENTQTGVYIAIATALAVSGVFATLIVRGTNKTLTRMANTLGEGAGQVASAAGQVSGSSQSLAQGASEQAAALEETTSALQEMSSMTRKNAEAAGQATDLAAEAKSSADKGNSAMHRMSEAINSIQKSAQDTAKIIKVIDEIAFQTNLLALNAAVEAARAGEAGKGFAVVAEEVRNLAMRSAEAAKNTASLIEESVQASRNGVAISTDVGNTLTEINTSVAKVNDLISEIARSSQEQSRGIDQVNQAVTQMDQVTQSSAANAEESAAAAEELSSQAAQLNVVVDELQELVSGARRNAANYNTATRAATKPAATKAFHLPAPAARTNNTSDFAEFRNAA